MRISMPRGDIKWQRFMVNTPNGTASDIDFTNIYFTVKEKTTDRQFIFQKSLQRGQIYKIGPGDYQFKITPADTNKMRFDEYIFDIQIQYKNLIKETFVGDFVLKGEVTYAENEDYEELETDITYPHTSEESATIVTIPDYHIIQLQTPLDIVTNTDYNDLANIPTINGVRVAGHLTYEDLNLLQSVTNLNETIVVSDGREIAVKISSKPNNMLQTITTEGQEGLYAAQIHTLTFGAHQEFVFDGTQDVTVPVYNGAML